MPEDLASANVNRSYSLAGTSIAIFTFILFFMFPRYVAREVDPGSSRPRCSSWATFSFVLASFSYYCASAGARFEDAERTLHARRGDRLWLLGYTLLFLAPSLILFAIGLPVVGSVWITLWLIYLALVVRYFPKLQGVNRGGGSRAEARS
jgi:hypothetical protein